MILQWTPLRNDRIIDLSLYIGETLYDTKTVPVTVLYPVLEVTSEITSYKWERGTDGLPSCIVSRSLTVTNKGTGPARNVHLTLDVEGLSTSLGTIPYLGAGPSYHDNWSTSLIRGYKYIGTVPLIEKCYGNTQLKAETAYTTSDAQIHSFDFSLGRRNYYDPKYIGLFITPDDPYIQNLLRGILDNKAWYDPDPDWKEIRDWVAGHVTYAYDVDVHGREYAQLPRETVMLGHGD